MINYLMKDKNSYKAIIFDLGGVIINLDYHRTANAFIDLGLKNFNEIYSKAQQSHLFDDFEKGIMPATEFRSELRRYLPHAISDEQIDAAWNAMLLDIPPARLEFLKQVGKKYRIFLLSNTNFIHVRAFTKMAEVVYGKKGLESCFEKHYYSCDMGMRKPDAEIFERVLADNKLIREETLFIDDSVQHIAGAGLVGLTAELLQVEKGEKVEEKYRFLLNTP